MEKDHNLIRFIEEKRKYEEQGWKVLWVFEVIFVQEIRQLYGKKMLSLENRIAHIEENPPKKLGDFLMSAHTKKKFDENISGVKIIHAGSRDGFSNEEIVLIDDELTDEVNKVKSQKFNEAIRKIVSNTAMTPDKTLLLINQDKHHQQRVGAKGYKENHTTVKMKQREKTSQAPGQKSITDFFTKTKTASSSIPYKKPIDSLPSKRPFEIENIAQKLRGDTVKILWLPKSHLELDATQYVSVFLLNEISRLIENDEDDESDVKTKCNRAIDLLPNQIWQNASEYVEDCENFYLPDDNASEDEDSEEDDKKNEREESDEEETK